MRVVALIEFVAYNFRTDKTFKISDPNCPLFLNESGAEKIVQLEEKKKAWIAENIDSKIKTICDTAVILKYHFFRYDISIHYSNDDLIASYEPVKRLGHAKD
jgi:hypothetical protein